jgi:hypothetical protein
MNIRYEYNILPELWRKKKEAVDWLMENVDDQTTYRSFSDTYGFRHAVGQTQEQADEIWRSALQEFRDITDFGGRVTDITIHQTATWSVYSIELVVESETTYRYCVFVSIPDEVTAVQCKLALS